MAQFLVLAQLTFREQEARTGVPPVEKEPQSAQMFQAIEWNARNDGVFTNKTKVYMTMSVKFATEQTFQ
jgi:hypothetical protein